MTLSAPPFDMTDDDLPTLSAADIFSFKPIEPIVLTGNIDTQTPVEPTPTITYNTEQQLGVSAMYGPVLIIAGAGSGKTRVVTGRIDNMIANGIEPSSILAITFTNKAANELKERLSVNARAVTASTIHSLCANLLRRFATYLGFKTGFSIYDMDDAQSLIRSIKQDIVDHEIADLLAQRPDASETYLKMVTTNITSVKERAILSWISKAKANLIRPDEYVHKMNTVDSTASLTAKFYKAYEEAKFADNAMDFDDLLVYTYYLLSGYPDVRNKIRSLFKYIIVDEYQDTNVIQNEIIDLMVSDNQDICVVGDPDQSIYKFRGADLNNILSFADRYPNANVIYLQTNYRSSQPILDVANVIINQNRTVRNMGDRKLVSHEPAAKAIKPLIVHATDGYEEAKYIIAQIQDYVKNGGSYKDIAILYRNSAVSRIYDNALRNANIPFKIHGGLSFYQRKEIKDLIAYLTILSNENANVPLKRVLNVPPRGIGNVTYKRIQKVANGEEPLTNGQYQQPPTSMVHVMLNHLDVIPKLTTVHRDGIKAFLSVFTTFDLTSSNTTVRDFIMHVIETTKYQEYIMNEYDEADASERINNIREFVSDGYVFDVELAEQFPQNTMTIIEKVQLFLQKIMLLSSSERTDDNADDTADPNDYVTLMTIHSAKGLEFPFVCVVQFAQNYLPSGLAIKDGEVEEECRLAYVATTRAKSKLIMSYADEYIQYGSPTSAEISQFLTPLSDKLAETVTLKAPNKKTFGFQKHSNNTFNKRNGGRLTW